MTFLGLCENMNEYIRFPIWNSSTNLFSSIRARYMGWVTIKSYFGWHVPLKRSLGLSSSLLQKKGSTTDLTNIQHNNLSADRCREGRKFPFCHEEASGGWVWIHDASSSLLKLRKSLFSVGLSLCPVGIELNSGEENSNLPWCFSRRRREIK